MKKNRTLCIIIVFILLLINVNVKCYASKPAIPLYPQSISILYDINAALKNDGTVLVTKNANCEKALLPNPSKWKDIVQISSGDLHLLGLKKDGTVIATGGTNDRGQNNVSKWTDIVQVCAGYNFSLGLRSDGAVLSTGLYSAEKDELDRWKNIKKLIVAESSTIIGIDTEGAIFSTSGSGQMDVFKRAFATWTDIVDIVILGPVAVGLRTDGTLITVGEETDPYYIDRTKISGWKNIVQIESGYNHVIGLKADGTVVGVGTPKFRNYGQYDVTKWKNIREIAAGRYYSVGLQSNGKLVFKGDNRDGQGNITNWQNIKVPPQKQLSKARVMSSYKLTVNLNGKTLDKVKPYFDSVNRIQVPIKALGEALGAKINSSKANSIEMTFNKRKIKFTKGLDKYQVNDLFIYMDTTVTSKNNMLYVPVNHISQALSCEVSYDPVTKKVSILPIKREGLQYTLVGAKAFTGKTEKVGVFTCPADDDTYFFIHSGEEGYTEVSISVQLLAPGIDKQVNALSNTLIQKVDRNIVCQIIDYIMPKITAYTENGNETYKLRGALIYDKKSGCYLVIEEANFGEIDINFLTQKYSKTLKSKLK